MYKKIQTGDFFAAFADAAILFPLLATLTGLQGFSGSWLLLSAGCMYILSGLFFRVPMSVQPLKSIAIAAISVGASASEVRISGGLLGLFCLLLSFCDVNTIAKRIPTSLIHGVQAALGVILIFQGYKIGLNIYVIILAALMILAPSLKGLTVMGVAATLGILWAIVSIFKNGSLDSVASAVPSSVATTISVIEINKNILSVGALRWGIVSSLLLPQMALTLANSVVGTADVCQRYFAPARKVTVRNLLVSIGIGNVISALVGGLPFCHGAGGITAHYKAGARHWGMNLVIGIFILILAGISFYKGQVIIQFSPVLLSALLISTGLMHLKLAKPTWNCEVSKFENRFQLIGMIIAVIFTKNILWALGSGILIELFRLKKSSYQ